MKYDYLSIFVGIFLNYSLNYNPCSCKAKRASYPRHLKRTLKLYEDIVTASENKTAMKVLLRSDLNPNYQQPINLT